jgi:hypothetical protein
MSDTSPGGSNDIHVITVAVEVRSSNGIFTDP